MIYIYIAWNGALTRCSWYVLFILLDGDGTRFKRCCGSQTEDGTLMTDSGVSDNYIIRFCKRENLIEIELR